MTSTKTGTAFRVVTVQGTPEERGRQYGAQARDLIRTAIGGYEEVFAHYTGWDWPTVRRHARRFTRPVAEFAPNSAREIIAIAEGAGVEPADILALNTRSEVMFAAPDPSRPPAPLECTSFALLARRTESGRPLAGQNWDWIEQVRATTVLLDVRRDDGPDFATIVEAGMLAKVGVNASGVGLCTNTLISDGDEGRIAVPYHVLLRSVLDSEHGADAAGRIKSASRANSANYLITDPSGFCVDLETSPAEDGWRELLPEDGVLTHANHFISDDLTGDDRYLQRKPHTRDRLRNITASLAARRRHGEADLRRSLADHRDAPNAVCQHPDPAVPAPERTCTVAGVVIDVGRRTLSYAAGNPCTAPWTSHTVGR
jgi:isopenicillin-N N-acyltransferase-like protein